MSAAIKAYIRYARVMFARAFCLYLTAQHASIMTAFALALPVVLGSVGMSLDLGQAYLVRQRLAGALDASALAGAAMATEEDDIRARVEEFFALNYPPEKIGVAYNLSVRVEEDEVFVSARADFNTVFMRVLGINVFTIAAQSIVVREVKGIEVAMVLDVTGSMSTNNNIGALREASRNFVNILYDRTGDPASVKIGLVPYSTSVNVGSYGVGLTPEGDDWEDGEDYGRGFVVDANGNDLPPARYTTNRTHNAPRWFGCVVENNPDGWDSNSTNNDPYPNDVILLREDEDPAEKIVDHEGPWPAYMYKNFTTSAACGQTCTRNWWGQNVCTNNSCHVMRNPPSYNCPRSRVVPLTSDRNELLTAINGFVAEGNTMGNIGMLWGYRILSPEYPFQQGAAWDDINWRKVVIMMTDGMNTMDSSYSAYWRTRNHQLRTNHQNQRFLESCETMKTVKGIMIYTITFSGGVDNNTKNFYRRCATSPAHFFDAPSQSDLIDVFQRISREIANLHLRG